jgi:X-X-X-Leu-X-X-Gly heptad repeat protein
MQERGCSRLFSKTPVILPEGRRSNNRNDALALGVAGSQIVNSGAAKANSGTARLASRPAKAGENARQNCATVARAERVRR